MDLVGQEVRVYWNLAKDVFSVQSRKTGRVIAHVKNIQLTGVKFNVRKGGRQRVLQEKRKNVHAFVEGIVATNLSCGFDSEDLFKVRYNPYMADYFFTGDLNLSPIFNSEECWLDSPKGKPRVRVHKEELGRVYD